MKVRINGKIVERKGYIDRDRGKAPLQEQPELEDDEQVVWMVGDPIPTIIKIK